MLYAPEFVAAEVAYRQERVNETYAAAGRRRQRNRRPWRRAVGEWLRRAHEPRLPHLLRSG